MDRSCIYKITNVINGKIYIGSSIDVEIRKKKHYYKLINNKHNNSHLQSSWNKYGESNFKFEIIEEVKDKDILLEREQYWLDKTKCYNRTIGFNVCKTAGNTFGFKHSEKTKKYLSKIKKGKLKGKDSPHWGKKHSIKRRKENSKRQKKYYKENPDKKRMGKNNPMYGKKPWNKGIICSEETKNKSRIAQQGEQGHSSKLTNENILKIRFLYSTGKYTQKQLAEEYGVTSVSISSIILRKTWKHI